MASPVVTTTITYVYDPLYRLKEANYSDSRYFHYTYDSVGNRLTETKCAILPCGTPVTNTYVYDNANRLTSVNGQTYQWDDNGNLLNDGPSTYVYDAANRLTSVSNQSSVSSYQYNGLGDRLSQTVDSVTTNYVLDMNAGLTQVLADGTNTYTYDIANRLTSVNGQTYTWDNNGNLLNDGTSTYTYDAANRLASVTQGTTLSSYTYNGLGDRLSQTVNSTTTNYVLDLNAGLTQVLADGTNTYLYGNGRIGELQPGGFAYHLGDALGSVRQLTDSGGGVRLARSFEAYGNTLNSNGTGTTTFAFTGEQWDSRNGKIFDSGLVERKRAEADVTQRVVVCLCQSSELD